MTSGVEMVDKTEVSDAASEMVDHLMAGMGLGGERNRAEPVGKWVVNHPGKTTRVNVPNKQEASKFAKELRIWLRFSVKPPITPALFTWTDSGMRCVFSNGCTVLIRPRVWR